MYKRSRTHVLASEDRDVQLAMILYPERLTYGKKTPISSHRTNSSRPWKFPVTLVRTTNTLSRLTHLIGFHVQACKPSNIQRPRRDSWCPHRHSGSNLLQQDVESWLRVSAPKIWAKALPSDKSAPCQRHMLALSADIFSGEIAETFIDGLLVEPRIHLSRSLLGTNEVLASGAGVWHFGDRLAILKAGVCLVCVYGNDRVTWTYCSHKLRPVYRLKLRNVAMRTVYDSKMWGAHRQLGLSKNCGCQQNSSCRSVSSLE